MGSPWEEWCRKKEGTVEPEITRLAEIFRSKGVRRILDVGCGAGRHVLFFAENGFEVYGFDQSQEAVEQAKKNLAQKKLGASLRVWNMVDPLPYEAGFFDAVLAVRVIHHTYLKNIERIFAELDRVTRVDGFLFLQVPSYETEIESKPDDPGTRWAEPGTLIARSGPEKGVLHHFFKKEELLRNLAKYEIREIHAGSDHYGGYCVIARKYGRRNTESTRLGLGEHEASSTSHFKTVRT